MEKIVLGRREFLLLLGLAGGLLILTAGFGYFLGRHEQVQLNKALLQAIPEINCGRTTKG